MRRRHKLLHSPLPQEYPSSPCDSMARVTGNSDWEAIQRELFALHQETASKLARQRTLGCKGEQARIKQLLRQTEWGEMPMRLVQRDVLTTGCVPFHTRARTRTHKHTRTCAHTPAHRSPRAAVLLDEGDVLQPAERSDDSRGGRAGAEFADPWSNAGNDMATVGQRGGATPCAHNKASVPDTLKASWAPTSRPGMQPIALAIPRHLHPPLRLGWVNKDQ